MNPMMIYIIVLQLLVLCFGTADLLPFSASLEQETHTFRWTTHSDLMHTACAIGRDLEQFYNLTVKNDEIENYRTGVKLPGFSTPELRREECASNASIFMLIGNPGIVRHLETGLCVTTKMQTRAIRGKYPNIVYDTSRFLTTGHECEYDNPNVARFKLNKNRPRRLSFIANVDPKTGKEEEWCIRNWLGSEIQVTPDCNGNNPFTSLQLPEFYFLEIFE